MDTCQYIYLHGFASGPQSRKAQELRRRFHDRGRSLQIPDLNQGDFSGLTLTRQIEQVEAIVSATPGPCILIGSSFGGLTAAWVAQRCTTVTSVLLLAPAFQFLDNWLPKFAAAQLQHWQETGHMAFYHYGDQAMRPLGYEFVTDLQRYDDGELRRAVPTLIIHGTGDEVVPLAVSQQFAASRHWVQLMAVESDHSLGEQLECIWAETARLCHLSNDGPND